IAGELRIFLWGAQLGFANSLDCPIFPGDRTVSTNKQNGQVSALLEREITNLMALDINSDQTFSYGFSYVSSNHVCVEVQIAYATGGGIGETWQIIRKFGFGNWTVVRRTVYYVSDPFRSK
ncbi:MAG: hypothetical protein ACT4QE_20640, partial [Anaerolineales bacterium]